MTRIAPPLADLYSPIREHLAPVTRIFEEELASRFPSVNALCDSVRSYRGKMLRPAMLLLSGKCVGELTEDHRTLATVIEMVHMATLVHDDVLDGADERRGQPPVNSMRGNTAAVLLGDYLISHAYHLCSSIGDVHAARRIAATTNTVCEGELLQNHHRGNADLSVTEYLDIVRRKTGALTAVSCELGAYYAGAAAPVVEAMRSYGMAAGIAFQIVDDVLDIVGNRKKVGKSLGTDLALGKLTLPTIHALAHGCEETVAAIRASFHGESRPEGEDLRACFEETGSIDHALSAASDHVSRALRQLDALPESDARQSLIEMAEFIIERQF